MPLLKITKTKKIHLLGNTITYNTEVIRYSPSTCFGETPEPSIISQKVSVFKYDYIHPYITPHLFVDSNGDKFIIPSWIPVHPKTQFEDINWIKPEVKDQPQEKNTWKFESSSDPGTFYTVRQSGLKLSCNCSGFWRAKDRNKGCKHCQEIRKQLNK
jgi:hypothetical protein